MRQARADRPRLPHVALDDIDRPFGTSMGRRFLSRDPDSEAATTFFDFPERWQGGGVAHYHSCGEEVYVIKGDITLDGRDYLTAGSYLYRPSGIVHGHNEGPIGGCRCLIRTDGPLDFNFIPEPTSDGEYVLHPSDDGRPFVLHLRTPYTEWTLHGDGQSRYGMKVLSTDRVNGSYTALVRLPAGWTGSLRLEQNVNWEWFVVKGLAMLSDGTAFETDSYSYRPATSESVAFTSAEADTDVLLWRIV